MQDAATPHTNNVLDFLHENLSEKIISNYDIQM